MKEAENPDSKSWKGLDADPPYLVKSGLKCAAGFMELVEKRSEFLTRVKMDLCKLGKPLSGRALYWMILNEFRTSRNAVGMMNINDLNRVNK